MLRQHRRMERDLWDGRKFCLKSPSRRQLSSPSLLQTVTKFYNVGLANAYSLGAGHAGGGLDRLDHIDQADGAAAERQHTLDGMLHPSRRHLAVVDPSRLRRECLKLALAQQSRRWRVSDVARSAALAIS